MTTDELLFLVYGIVIGLELMIVMNTFWDRQAARRSQTAARAARRIAGADHFYASLVLYQLQHREGAHR